MADKQDSAYKLTAEEYKKIKDEMEVRLSDLQQKIIKAKIPVIVLFEGYATSGKGSAISSLILNLDPRGFEVHTTRRPNETEERLPWLQRFAVRAPELGRIAVFDRAWYSGLTWVGADQGEQEMLPYLEDINTFERQLAADGVVLIKFFLSIPKKEQKKRIDKLKEDKNTSWRVTKEDERQNKHYEQTERFYKAMITVTDTPYAKWHVIYAKDRRYTRAQVMQTVAEALEAALANPPKADVEGPVQPKVSDRFHLLPAPRIEDVDLNQVMTREEYTEKLDALQDELSELHNVLYNKKIPVVIAYEGNDAAGKGGSIRRVARALDPRGYTVHPIAGPTPTEKAHNHLWRFYTKLPRTGHIAVFDRTWYGRVLVERVEHFTPTWRIEEGYQEINEFEYMLHKWGCVIIKFWLAIDKDEQLRRFQDRQNTPSKQWKITDEDWRNRDKWDQYVEAVDDMIKYTNTNFAPWTIVEADSKYFARIKTLQTVIDSIKKRLGK
ncbi:MAG: polyphosphate:AMP phosphotransferase [Clostridia bacterium]|nr:polyphosphate:AMP phosphotransferase [Clostridia bacterium]